MPDPFFDSFQAEGLACYDIIKKVDETQGEYVNVTFKKDFLRHIVHSHMIHIRRLEKDLNGRVYAH